jgi:DNA-binding MarR family transcriptional regulator
MREISIDLFEPGPIEEGRTAEFLKYWLKQRPDLDAEAMAIDLTVARIGLLARRSIGRIAEGMGLMDMDYRIMAVIQRGGPDGPTRPSDLWKLFNLTPGAITYRVDRLVEMGLVERSGDSSDRRLVLLRLTAQGEAKVAAIMTTLSALLRDRLTAVDEITGGRDMLRRLLAALARRWEATEEETGHGDVQEV